MSYLIKFQPTPVLVDSVLKNSKHCGAAYHSLSPNFLGSHSIFRTDAQKYSTHVSALKTLPVKKKATKCEQNILHKKKAIVLQNLTKIMEVKDTKANRKKKTTLKSSQALSEKFYQNHNFDSTKSYDPNLLDHNPEIEVYFKENGAGKFLETIKTSSSAPQMSLELPKNEMAGDITPVRKKQTTLVKDKKTHKLEKNLNVSGADLSRFMKIQEANQEKPMEDSFQEPLFKENKLKVCKTFSQRAENEDVKFQEILTFQNFTERVSSFKKKIEELHSTLDIYITNGLVDKGFEIMDIYRRNFQWKSIMKEEKLNSLFIYNTLLEGLSEKGNWDSMLKVTQWMAEDNIKLNCHSFASLFYCLAEIKESRKAFSEQEVVHIINQLFANNISLNDIFSKTSLSKEKTEKILAVIQEAVPSFDIQPVKINLSSNCPLTKNLLKVSYDLQPPLDNVGIETMRSWVEEQLLLEKKFMVQVKSVSEGYTKNVDLEKYRKKASELKNQWRESLTEALNFILKENNLNSIKKPNLYVYLNSIPPEIIVNRMMEMTLELVEFASGYSPSSIECCLSISSKISNEFYIKKKLLKNSEEKTKSLLSNYLSWYLNPCGPARNSRQKWQMLIQDSNKTSSLDVNFIKWPENVKKKLGKFLLDLIIREVKFPIEVEGQKKFFPVLCTVLRFRNGAWREEIKCHPHISKLFAKSGFEILNFRVDNLPMVCPPKPWKSATHGGFLILQADLIRKSFNCGKVIRLKDVPLQNMYPTLDALNALQGVPWRINEEILDLVLKVFRSGGSEKLSVPYHPSTLEPDTQVEDFQNLTFRETLEKHLEKKRLIKKKNEAYSLWCEALYRLSLADHFRKRIFWLPQNCDFRGRVYPVPSLLNHLGSDLYRSLLIFAKGKPLGPKGLDWLKIHLINLTGKHKRETVLERLAFANEILPLILDSAEKPFTGFKWWMESEEPWQTLATCIEIKKALSSPDPEKYVSHFPVHQDGSCNGLQHYAGLGKDVIGAQSVNLSALGEPADVYSLAAKLVEEERAKDEEAGNEIARRLRGSINRKLIKQTVMTTVYGVTEYGAKLQISKRLEEESDFPEQYVNPAALYLTKKIFLSLKKMFCSAREIQSWLVECAESIVGSNEYVQWMTPLGLPVIQSYGKYKSKSEFHGALLVPDKRKQKNAFPPNYIHSLDSSHMMLTALFCEQAGITFAAVHDCFWTHPITVDYMNVICREQFISLHSQPLLENLSQFFIRQYLQNNMSKDEKLAKTFEAIPAKGSFDIKEVLKSVYFFS